MAHDQQRFQSQASPKGQFSSLPQGAGPILTGSTHSAHETLFADILTSRVKLLRGVGSALSLVSDFVVVGAMFYHMQPGRNPGMASPDGFYETVVVYGFNRGTAFTVGQVLSFIVFLTSGRRPAWVLVAWVAAKLYANSLLAMYVSPHLFTREA